MLNIIIKKNVINVPGLGFEGDTFAEPEPEPAGTGGGKFGAEPSAEFGTEPALLPDGISGGTTRLIGFKSVSSEGGGKTSCFLDPELLGSIFPLKY